MPSTSPPLGYTIVLQGPGGCAVIPYFELRGPGESIANNLTEGELDNDSVNAYLQPNSTYTFRDDNDPLAVWTFTTSSASVGVHDADDHHSDEDDHRRTDVERHRRLGGRAVPRVPER